MVLLWVRGVPDVWIVNGGSIFRFSNLSLQWIPRSWAAIRFQQSQAFHCHPSSTEIAGSLPPRDGSLLTCLQRHFGCQRMTSHHKPVPGWCVLTAGGGAPELLPCSQGSLTAWGLQKESKPSGVFCCVLSLLEGLPASSLCPTLSALAPSKSPLPPPCMPAEGMQRLCQSCTLNETNLFCTWPPTSSACLDVKVKLHYYRRIDFT